MSRKGSQSRPWPPAPHAGRGLPALILAAVLLNPSQSLAAAEHRALVLLETHCVRCHGGEATKAGFDMTRRESLLRGGDDGAVVLTGDPAASQLYLRVTHTKDPGMPYKKPKLEAADIATIADWIRAGVPYERPVLKSRTTIAAAEAVTSEPLTDEERNHWAFQPVRRAGPPPVKNAEWVRNDVDRFVLAALEAKGLKPAPPAAREQLLRRVTFDLIGLPPTLEEINDFLRDDSPRAYEKVVDRLLSSPHYGERWGRHWLDLARYGETDGFEHDAVRPNAWRYRDYVIRAFNADKPYDRFVREQLAGDELYPDEPDAVIATAFNLMGPDMVDSADQLQRRHNTLNDITDTAGLAFLGLTMGCARCHDHKFEPLSQRDYYQLQAFFTPVQFQTDLPVLAPGDKAAYAAAMTDYLEKTKTERDALGVLEAPVRKKIFEQKLAKLSDEARAAFQTPPEKRTTEQLNQIQETAELVEVSDTEVNKAMSPDERSRQKKLKDELKRVPAPAAPTTTMALQNPNKAPARTYMLIRGDVNNRGEEVRPGFPRVVAGDDGTPTPPDSPATGRRARLAGWIASPSNPLTARVMANRVWQHHFGRGIVATASDFGFRGKRPTHPELLDWLASEFVSQGWSVKALHRLLLLSATYQQSVAASTEALARDPENLLYSRRDRIRLEGEVIRDSLLAISGVLNPAVGGHGVFPAIPLDVFKGSKGWSVSSKASDRNRRSIYIFARRNLRFPFLEVFDAPDSNLSCPERGRSTSAPQSLTLLNADEVIAAASATAGRIGSQTQSSPAQIDLACRMVLGRHPTPKEEALAKEFLSRSPLPEFCRALFNLNAFVYVD
jgi:mono/diheme cytochrome c family protein